MKKALLVIVLILLAAAVSATAWGVYRFMQVSAAVDRLGIESGRHDASKEYDRPSVWQIKRNLFITGYILNFDYRGIAENLNLAGDERVLDFGCGSGAPDIFIAEKLSRGRGRLTCMDISPLWQKAARLRLQGFTNVDYICGDITSLPMRENEYDVILVNYVIHGIDRSLRPTIVRALSRVLKPGGRLHINEPDEGSHSMSPEEIRELMSASGLKEVSMKRAGVLGPVMARHEGIFVK